MPNSFPPPEGSDPSEGPTPAGVRPQTLLRFFADREAGGYHDRIGFMEVLARMALGRPYESIGPALDPLLEDPHGDMFWMYPTATVAALGHETLPDTVRRRLRELWRTYTPYRGDTENHWLVYYASLYVMTSLYPDDPAESWFDGRSSQEHLKDAESYIRHWAALTLREGQGEFSSPHYLPFFLTPLAMLYRFAQDEPMRRLAKRMLDRLVREFAAVSLGGLYAGAFSRIYPEPTLERWKNGSTTFAWLLFGTGVLDPQRVNVILPRIGYRPHGSAVILALSGYEPPADAVRLATHKSASYVVQERHRTRTRIRYSERASEPVHKTTYVDPDFVLGSMQGGLLQPIQQHTWELLWRTDEVRAGFNVLFSLHAYSAGHELGMYFPEEPRLLTESVISAEKPTYDDPWKWTGGSPYERITQHNTTLLALYDLPEEVRHPVVSLYLSRRLEDLRREDEPPGGSGWIFARAGRCFVGVYPLTPMHTCSEAGGDQRLHTSARQTGYVVHVQPARDWPSYASFLSHLRTKTAATSLPNDVSERGRGLFASLT